MAQFGTHPATPYDRNDIAAMVRARAEWMREREVGNWQAWYHRAEQLAAEAVKPWPPTFVVRTLDWQIAGITTLTPDTPALGWTGAERAEPAVFMHSTVTHPMFAGQMLGTRLAFWSLSYAAGLGLEWVRRGVFTRGNTNRGLVRYYRTQGWRVVRTARHPERHDMTVWSMQRHV